MRSAAEFQKAFGVSDPVRQRLEIYAALLERWQKRINLVGPATLPNLWRRHFADSAQLLALLPSDARTLVDLGSGAGFPGLVLAIMGAPGVHLVESDQRKAAFLREVSRETMVPVTLHVARAEQVEPFAADVVTARALAPLPRLLELARPFLGPRSVCLFPKGKTVESELTEIPPESTMMIERIPSRTDPSAAILRLKGGFDE